MLFPATIVVRSSSAASALPILSLNAKRTYSGAKMYHFYSFSRGILRSYRLLLLQMQVKNNNYVQFGVAALIHIRAPAAFLPSPLHHQCKRQPRCKGWKESQYHYEITVTSRPLEGALDTPRDPQNALSTAVLRTWKKSHTEGYIFYDSIYMQF